MTTNQNPFSRSDLNEELRLLLGAERGIDDAEALRLRLPLLRDHPAITSQTPKDGARKFQRGLEQALGTAIARSGESEAMQNAVRWHLALDRGDVIEDAKARRERAAKIARSPNLNRYWKDRPGQQRPDLTVALESVEAQLEILGQASLGRPRVKVGGVEIPDILLLATCSYGQDATQEMTLEFEDTLRDERADCEEWPLLGGLLSDLTHRAKAAGRDLENRPALDLVYAEELDRMTDAPRRCRLGLAETSYNRWVATANALDEPLGRYRKLTERLGSDTLRQAWGHAPGCLEDLADLPAPCLLGVCVVVVVDEQIVVLARQRKHYVVGAEPSSANRSRQPTPVHFIGEGAEPKDFASSRNPPEKTALRGCWEEMKLDAKDVDLVPTAFVFDTLRWQPVFCYLAFCKLTMPEVETRMKEAEHSQETGQGQIAALLSPTVTDPDTRALLTGSHPSMRLASNHAAVALLYALAYLDGLERVASDTSNH